MKKVEIEVSKDSGGKKILTIKEIVNNYADSRDYGRPYTLTQEFYDRYVLTTIKNVSLNNENVGYILISENSNEIKSAIDEDMDLLASFDRIKFPARGRLNGSNGKPGQVSIKGKGKLNGKGTQLIKAGDILQIYTPGGAGLGDYSEREQSLLDKDLENEFL